jgi:uncharacterized membrane protein YdbT with pleckstrin-like domain
MPWPGCFGLPLVFGSRAPHVHLTSQIEAAPLNSGVDRTLKITIFVVVVAIIAVVLSVWLFQPPGWGRF